MIAVDAFGSRPTTTSCARSPTGTVSGSWKTPPARPARPTEGGPPVAWPTPRASPSTAARASPPARVGRSRLTTPSCSPMRASCTSSESRVRSAGPAPTICRCRSSTNSAGTTRCPRSRPPSCRPNWTAAEAAGGAPAGGRRLRRTAGRLRRSRGAGRAGGPRDRVAVLRAHPGAAVDRGRVAADLRGARHPVQHRHLRLAPAADLRTSAPCPVSADIFARHLAIPMHANLTDGQVEIVAKAVREAVASARSSPLTGTTQGADLA